MSDLQMIEVTDIFAQLGVIIIRKIVTSALACDREFHAFFDSTTPTCGDIWQRVRFTVQSNPRNFPFTLLYSKFYGNEYQHEAIFNVN